MAYQIFSIMSGKKQILLLFIVLVFVSCSSFKKQPHTSSSTLPSFALDTVNVTAQTKEPSAYQPSATRLSDIIHTRLEVSFDWAKQYLFGKATITAKPYFYPSSSLVLDARGMEIKLVALVKKERITTVDKNVKQDKKKTTEPLTSVDTVFSKVPLTFAYDNSLLTIYLDKEYKSTEPYTVYIEYTSKPNELKKKGGSEAITDDKGLYFINPDGSEKDKPMEIWTQGETQSNSVWFPTIDRPNERMTQEIFITTDKKYVTLSNGELISSTDNGDNTRTDYWKMDLPHAPYLAMMAIGDFAIVKDKWRDREVNYYVEKEYEPYAKAIFGNTPEMIEFFSTRLGVPFVWNKYSQIVVRDYVSGAMENTTATLHSEFLQQTDRELLDVNYEEVISHELFHSWFGDLVTCESWSNTPLNESFATYGEYLWEEHKYGKDEADYRFTESRLGYLNEAQRKQVPLIRYQFDDREDMFDRHSYNKGGQVLHMLRKYVGDEAFFAALKLYLENNKFNSVEIHNLRLSFEQVTGEDLNWFFNQWFLSPGHPVLDIKTEYDEIRKKERVEIKQKQNLTKTPLYILPLYIDIYINGQVERKQVTLKKADELMEFDAPTRPDLVNVDAEKQLLCEKTENKSNKELAFQYLHAPLYLDRAEALVGLSKFTKDSLAAATIIGALNDKFYSLRGNAIATLPDFKTGHEKEIKEKLMVIAAKDAKAEERAAAIDYLSNNYKDDDLLALYKNALNDKAYSVLGAALSALSKTNPQEGMKQAKQYENEKNKRILNTIADLYATYGTDDNNDFFVRIKDKYKGFSAIEYISLYVNFLKNVKKEETVNSGVAILTAMYNETGSIKWVQYYAKKSIYDLAMMYEDKEKKAAKQIDNLKAANINAVTTELEFQMGTAKDEKLKLMDVFNGLK